MPLPALAQTVPNEAQSAEADRLLELGRQQYRVSQFREALQSWQAALEIYQAMGNRAGETKTLNNIGIIYARQGNYGDALATFQQSLIMHQGLGDRTGEAQSLGNIANVYQSQGSYGAALTTYQQILVVFREIADWEGEATTLNNIGVIHENQGNYGAALTTYQQSLAMRRELGDRAGEAQTLNNIGLIYQLQGNYGAALTTYQQSLILRQGLGDRAGEAITLNNIGVIYQLLGNYGAALTTFQQSLIMRQDLGDRAGEATTLMNIGIIYRLLGNYEAALTIFQQSLTISQELGDRDTEATILMNVGIIYRFLENYEEALSLYQQSLTTSRELGDRDAEAATLENLGYLWHDQGEAELAIVFLKASVNVYEDIRQSNQALEQSLKDSYLTTIEDTYRFLADLLIQQERILEAQRVLDLLKVQELDTFLRGVRSNSNTQAGVELVPPEAQIVRAYNALVDRAIANGKRLSELEAKTSLTAAEETEMVTLQGERRELLQAFNQFRTSDLVQGALAQLSPAERDRNLQLGQLAALQDNLSQIPQGAVLLYPFILEDRLELVVTSPYAPPIHRTVNVTPAQLAAAVQAFRYALEEPTRDALTPAQQLYDWLIAPIEADLQAAGVNTLIYAPDRVLRYIPLAALHDGDQWLAERYRINHITAASLTDLNTPPITQPRILAGALTEGPVTIEAGGRDYTFQFLRHAEAEVNGIAALDPRVNPLLGANFNPDQVEREANRHTIVHLATHAKFLVGQPEDSFILFSNRDRWTLADFNAGLLNLTRVDLVVLSACETGVDNTFGNGEEILGFGYLMQAAGARAAMASLWAVDDGGTQILMGEFYNALLRGGLGKAEALRQAQLSLIHLGRRETRGFELAEDLGLDPNDLAHPHYWAPFILIGNGL
ncbi:tetratricopeptide repeat protein [Phormidium sp. FACHB-1136]|nr:tetratricopeptide repeat protein [Phormidium sp. FACHB-1136]